MKIAFQNKIPSLGATNRGGDGPSLAREPSTSQPQCSLSNTNGFWELTLFGAHGVLPHHHALFFLACLLTDPPTRPLDGPSLAKNVVATFAEHQDFSRILDIIPTPAQETARNRILQHRIDTLERVLHDDQEIETYKHEPRTEALHLYHLQDNPLPRPPVDHAATGQNILNALLNLYNSLATATNLRGAPNRLQRDFAVHILAHILIPSIRHTAKASAYLFTYQPPPGTAWS